MSKASSAFIGIISVGFLLSGAGNSLAVKVQDLVEDSRTGKDFFHPSVQTFIMFIAEFSCLVIFNIMLKTSANFKKEYDAEWEKAQAKGQGKVKLLYTLFPACCDICSTTMQYLAIFLMEPSIYVMLRGGLPITTALFSVMFLGRKLNKNHVLGLSFVVIGITIVGISGVQNSSGESNNNFILGLIFCMLSLVGNAVQFIIEEKLLANNYLHPLQLVGYEGSWGLVLSTIAVTIASFVSCDNSAIYCNSGTLENLGDFFHTYGESTRLLVATIITMITLGFFNFFGLTITKYLSSLARAIIMMLVTVVVWAYSLAFLDQKFYWLQLFGFVFVVLGNLFYQQIIKVFKVEEKSEDEEGGDAEATHKQKLIDDSSPTTNESSDKHIVQSVQE